MKNFLKNKNKANILLGILLAVVFGQALIIGKLFTEKDQKNYEVNLVKINTEKDSIDYLKMKNDLTLIDSSVREINGFLLSKNITNERIMTLDQDSLDNAVYLAKVSNRYSQYLVDLQQKLQQVPLGIPTSGYISSNFGKRINPIPVKRTVMMAAVKAPALEAAKPEPQIIEEKDSLGNVVKRTVIPASATAAVNKSKAIPTEQNNPPAEADQIQFHKGMDFAVPYGTDVRSAAIGTVIFAGQKGGYGNCVIISHGNGLATLYGHLSQILVQTNDQVKVNQVIAKSGNSGRSTGPHLHYEVHKNNTPVNPKLFLNF
ncbi:M23 family metallopeptidase [Chryseobacterium taklimakanense]|uniref:M23 family metallopeptidase n=1 Tax=Chryseobacterium taklimakanense TaxID=536441 RepID=UPI001EF400CB|nr:M23 family metallopeptidase [Chryseobacterium taklimakanense]MCG7280070.1 M23 family metallopeptidase [Chryseobacterium taklimakanense]